MRSHVRVRSPTSEVAVVLAFALRAGCLLLDRTQKARRGESDGVDGVVGEDAEVDARRRAGGALLVELAGGLVLELLLLGLREEWLAK